MILHVGLISDTKFTIVPAQTSFFYVLFFIFQRLPVIVLGFVSQFSNPRDFSMSKYWLNHFCLSFSYRSPVFFMSEHFGVVQVVSPIFCAVIFWNQFLAVSHRTSVAICHPPPLNSTFADTGVRPGGLRPLPVAGLPDGPPGGGVGRHHQHRRPPPGRPLPPPPPGVRGPRWRPVPMRLMSMNCERSCAPSAKGRCIPCFRRGGGEDVLVARDVHGHTDFSCSAIRENCQKRGIVLSYAVPQSKHLVAVVNGSDSAPAVTSDALAQCWVNTTQLHIANLKAW